LRIAENSVGEGHKITSNSSKSQNTSWSDVTIIVQKTRMWSSWKNWRPEFPNFLDYWLALFILQF